MEAPGVPTFGAFPFRANVRNGPKAASSGRAANGQIQLFGEAPLAAIGDVTLEIRKRTLVQVWSYRMNVRRRSSGGC